MKAKLKFNKYGAMKFLGHLDLMRYFQKAFNRAGIDIAYSQGYSPHQLTSFASPLGVGLTSDGEYMEMQLNSCESPETMIEMINSQMADGISVVSFHLQPEDCTKAMTAMAGADYRVSVKDGYDTFEQFQESFTAFMEQEEITVMKTTKKGEKEVNIKPLIYTYAFDATSFRQNGGAYVEHSVAQEYNNDNIVYLQVKAGSVDNLKPNLVMEAFCQYSQREYNEFAFQFHRIEMYTNIASEDQEPKLVPLSEFQVI